MKLQKLLSLTRQAIDAYGMIEERTVLHFSMHCPIYESSIQISLIL